MKISYFNTFYQILVNDSIDPILGIFRHFEWLIIRLFNLFPRMERISNSNLLVNKPNGPIALVHIFGLYDFHNMNLIQHTLRRKPDLWFIDIGANIGTYTLIAAETGAKVLAIEPHPITYNLLTRNIAINGFTNVFSENCAATEQFSSLKFSDYQEDAINKIEKDGPLTVDGIPLDALITKYAINQFILKVDTEGHDFQVIKGACNNLHKCLFMIVEDGNELIQEYLSVRGYSNKRYYDYQSGEFLITPQHRREDPIYINKAYNFSGDEE